MIKNHSIYSPFRWYMQIALGSILLLLKNEYKNRLEVVKNEFGNQNIITNNYLSDNESLVKSNIEIFMDLAKQFYESKKAGIEVKNNEGVNQQRFEINAKIQDDAGDGVNEVKIFCFDWTLLKGRHNHSVEFLFHDSRLLSDMDPRQKATLMKIAHEQTIRDGTQYIISANEDQLQSMQQYLGEEYSTVIDHIALPAQQNMPPPIAEHASRCRREFARAVSGTDAGGLGRRNCAACDDGKGQ